MSSAQRLSTWLMPDEAGSRALQSWIDRLGGALGSHPFPPHITLVGGFDADAGATAALMARGVAGHPAFQVRFTHLEFAPVRFRAITLRAEPEPALVRLKDALEAELGVDAGRYQPHLSLAYSELDDPRKRSAASALAISLPVEISVDRVELWGTDESDLAGWSPLAQTPLRS